MVNWDNEIEKLKDYVFTQKLSYEEIGRIYNCTGGNIKKVMQRRGIELPIRSKNAGKEPINIALISVNMNMSINNGFSNIKKIILQLNLLNGVRYLDITYLIISVVYVVGQK